MSDYEKPCPFCGSTNLKSGGDDKIVGTWCLDCEATGPNHYGRYEWNDRVDRIEELEAKLEKAVEALDGVMVGGNHLATILPDNFPPAETEPLIALEKMGYGYDFEVWCCWRSIMLARTTLEELTGGKDE